MSEPLTDNQALAVARVVAQADGGCSHCALNLAGDLAREWPEHPWWALVLRAGGWDEERELAPEDH